MRTVSKAFKDAMKAPRRKMKARASFDIVSDSAYNDVTVTSTSSEKRLPTSFICNKIREQSYAPFTHEKGYSKMDGSCCVLSSGKSTLRELCWASNTLSDDNCNIDETITITFGGTYSFPGLGILFDRIGGTYATDFIVTLVCGGVSESITINNNHSEFWQISKEFNNVSSITIQFTRLNNPQQRLKIVEVDLGLVQEWDDEKIVKIEHTQEVSWLCEFLPTDTVNITIINKDGEFDMLNPKGMYSLLKEHQRLKYEIGIELENGSIEWCHMGSYYLTNPKIDEGGITATFECKNYYSVLDGLISEDFVGSSQPFWGSYSTNIKDRNGETIRVISPNYALDVSKRIASDQLRIFENSKPCSTSEWLRQLSICAFLQFIPCDEKGSSEMLMKYRDLSREINLGFTVDSDNQFDTPKIQKLDSINSCSVTSIKSDERGFSEDTAVIVEYDEYTINGDWNYFYSDNPSSCPTITYTNIGTGAKEYLTLNSSSGCPDGFHQSDRLGNWYVRDGFKAEYATWGVKIKATDQVTQLHEVKIIFWTYNNAKIPLIGFNNNVSGKAIEYDLQTLYPCQGQLNLIDYVLNSPKYKLTVNWRGNPALECCDRIYVEDNYNKLCDGVITKHVLTYDGSLSSNTEVSVLRRE